MRKPFVDFKMAFSIFGFNPNTGNFNNLRFKRYDFTVNSSAKVNPIVESSLILFFKLAENILNAFVQSLKGILAK